MNNKTKPFTQVTLEDLAGLRGLGASSILVYMALRIYGGKDSTAWPSQDRIASNLGMPIGSVRRALAQLRERKAIVKTNAKTKSPTYQIQDLSIADMRCPEKPKDLGSEMSVSQIRDPSIADMRSEDRRSDHQIDKEYIKENIHTTDKLNSTKTDLTIETEEKEEEIRIEYPNLISFEEAQRMRDLFSAKKGASEEASLDELDLLFVKLWERHSVTQRWIPERSPVEDFQKIRQGLGRTQIIKGLKELDVYINGLTAVSNKWAGLRWFDGLRSWLQKRPDTWTARDAKKLSKCIHVTPAEVEGYNRNIEAAKIEEKEEVARSLSGSQAREMWAGFCALHPDQESRVQAIQKARVFADADLCREIKGDPDLAEFALIVSVHADLASLSIIK